MAGGNGEYSESWRIPLGAAGASSPPPVFGFENRRCRDPNRLVVTRQFLSADGGTGLGNYLLTVPILDLPGRNLDLRLNLYHNSNVWNLGRSRIGPYLYFDYDRGFPAP